MKKSIKGEESELGITLIALVITIVILVILVGVSVNIMINKGLITNTKKATEGWKGVQNDEQKLMDEYEQWVTTGNMEHRHTYSYDESSEKLNCFCGDVQEVTQGLEECFTVNESGELQFISAEQKGKFLSTFSGELILPSKLGDKTITSIPDAFMPRTAAVRKVIIPDGVTSIGKYAFQECNNLTEVSLPSTLTLIENQAFYKCSSLEKINIPNKVKKIEGSALSYTAIKEIYIPTSVEEMKSNVIFGCTSLQRAVVGNVPDYIFNYAYAASGGKSILEEVIVLPGVKTIGKQAFLRCANLKKVELPNTLEKIGSEAFSSCTGLEQINIPSSVNTIEGGAFNNCSSLTEITIPSTVTNMGNNIMSGCTGLKKVSLGNIQGMQLGYYVPNLEDMELLEGVTSITNYQFASNRNLKTVTLPSTMTSLGEGAFIQCANLATVRVNMTKEQWNQVAKGERWNAQTLIKKVICTDGEVEI